LVRKEEKPMSDRYVKSILVKKYEREETEDEENKATLFTEKKNSCYTSILFRSSAFMNEEKTR